MKKTFLITGGTGFIGSNLSNRLLIEGYKVVVFDNNQRGKISRLNKNIKFVRGDIRSKKNLSLAFKNIDAVIHLAYVNGTKFFYSKPELVLDVATKGLINVFDLCIKNKIKELYLASSSEVYQLPDKIPTDENVSLKIPDIQNPRFSYAGGKILTELYGMNYGKKYFKKLIIFRPHNVYGPDMGVEHVIPELLKKFKKVKKNQKLKIEGTGNETRSFIYISDFCEAFLTLIKYGKHLNIYNIGTENRVKISKIIDIIKKITKKKIKISKTKLKTGGTKHRCPDIKKIKKLGFKPEISLIQGIKKCIFQQI